MSGTSGWRRRERINAAHVYRPGVAALMAGVMVGVAVMVCAGEPAGPTAARLGGDNRPLAFLSTDKPIYRPGETLYARAVALMADSFFPVRSSGVRATLTITGPRDEEIARIPARLEDSSAGFAWIIPSGLAGGRYLARVEIDHGPPAVRPFEIRVYAPPRLSAHIDFEREGYGPGDTVAAVAMVRRAEGGVPVGATVTAVARVDGAEVARVAGLGVGADGACHVRFSLPDTAERGEGTLALVIEDGGVVETTSKTIPILLQTLDIDFYPEGGDMVQGLPGRVYVQARRPDGKPADIEGEIIRLDTGGMADGVVATVRTEHEGRGAFSFTPDRNCHYALKLHRPAGIDRLFTLPPVRASGAVVRSDKGVFSPDEPVSAWLASTPDRRPAWATLYHREREVAKVSLAPEAGSVELDPGDVEGVLMLTLWDADGVPLAERLVFREPKFAVRVELTTESVPSGGEAVPGGRVRLTVRTTDDSGRPVEAVVGLAVTDDALLQMVERRDQAPALPVMAYLENEVADLADAGVYLDPEDPAAADKIDLLLGTQGWRRFLLVRLDEARAKYPDAVRRALAIRVSPPPRPMALRDRQWLEQPVALFAVQAGMVEEAVPAPAMELVMDDTAVDPMAAAHQTPAPLELPPLPPLQATARKPDAEAKRLAPPVPEPMLVIREYAHAVRPGRRANERRDFSETIYWHAGLRTNPRSGTAVVEFDCSDSITTFRVRADAFAGNGALGAGESEFASVEPFSIEAKLPNAAVAGDRMAIPVVLVNATGEALEEPSLLVRGEGLDITVENMPDRLGPDSRVRALVRFTATPGEHSLIFTAAAGGRTDTVVRTLTVSPRGFPAERTASGRVGPETPFVWRVTIDREVIPGSLRTIAKIHPTPLATMNEALTALLRQPHGCFEQTSSTSYPLVMARQYFLTHAGTPAETVRRSGELLDDAYRRLLSFECGNNGYEWFGGDPGHEALTAYGLMQFVEMARVMPVDTRMIDRTRAWLLARRDGSGGFSRNPKALDSFGSAPAPLTNLYILWTLLESGEEAATLDREIAATRNLVAETDDPYILALGANVLHLSGDSPAARAAADKLRKRQIGDGSIPGAKTTITRSGGNALVIETTSLAVLAWLRLGDKYVGAVEESMAWLFEHCRSGRFGSTQSTILALKAINAYDASRSGPVRAGTVRLVLDGKPFGRPVHFDPASRGALELADFAAALTPGDHTVELVMDGGEAMPFTLAVEYTTPHPATSPDCPLELETTLSHQVVTEGEPVDLKVRVLAHGLVSMPLAVVGIPAGLEPRHERLKEMLAEGRMAAYEIIGQDMVLYWRVFRPGDSHSLSIPLVARSPGSYTGPACRVYGYYLDEHKAWVAGETVEVRPR